MHPPSDVVLPCQREPIEALFLDEQDRPVASILVRLRRSPSSVHDLLTDTEGRAHFDGLDPGSYEFVFPELDRDAWSFLREEPLVKREGIFELLSWNSPEAVSELPHSVIAEENDCLTSLAFQFGFLPETIWKHEPNRHLDKDRDSMNLLVKGDEIFLPPRRIEPHRGQTIHPYIFRLVGYPAMLRVRFLDDRFYPRKEVPYLLILQSAGSEPIRDREGVTNSEGFLIEPIPPQALRGEIWLGKGEDREIWPIELGCVRPDHVEDGVKSRLGNLGYGFDPASEDEFADALRAFQWDAEIPITGKADDATIAKLAEFHLS